MGEVAKYTAVLALMGVSIYLVRKKLSGLTWDEVWQGIVTIPKEQIALAILFTAINFVVLTGYDLIAVRYLKKQLPIRRVMVGAIIGYAMSNVLGWMIGGTAIRFRLYASWGFRLIEIIALVSILSVTFWLGMFLLAGIAFVMLPVHLPAHYQDALHFSPHLYGYVFLGVVGAYLLATIFIRKPVHIGNQEFAFPPFRLSLLQLGVSATDFALASLVLWVLLPADTVNYSTVLVSYMAAMIVTVVTHVPGGFGILELVIMELLTKQEDESSSLTVAVTAGLVVFRVVYYFAPAALAGVLLARQEWKHALRKRQALTSAPDDGLEEEPPREVLEDRAREIPLIPPVESQAALNKKTP
ncbi:MAG: lysylphosphatidylglycerol synthase transmembrane domain-containing protein [Aureliella sp.]